MSEKQTRKTVLKALRSLDAQPVENICVVGYPDVEYIGGHIELKTLDKLPVRGGPVRIEHYTAHQKLWLLNRWRKGGRAFLLIQYKREWLLFDAIVAQDVGTMTYETMKARTIAYWDKGLVEEQLIKFLTEDFYILNKWANRL